MDKLWASMFRPAAGGGGTTTKRKREEDDNTEEEHDMEDAAAEAAAAAAADYTTVPTLVRRPYRVHSDAEGAWNLTRGAMWSVDHGCMPAEVLAEHLAALTATPHKLRKDSADFDPPVPIPLARIQEGRLYMPPVYAAHAFPGVPITRCELVVGEEWGSGATFTGKLWQSYPPQQAAVDTWKAWHDAGRGPCILSLP